MGNEKVEISALVRVVAENRSGVVIGKAGAKWLVAFADGTSALYRSGELEVNAYD